MPWHRWGLAKLDVVTDAWRGPDDHMVTAVHTCEKCGALACKVVVVAPGKEPEEWEWYAADNDSGPDDHPPPCVKRGNNMLPAEKVERVRALASSGAGIREIARETGIDRHTVSAYVGGGDKAAGLRRHHARRKAEGRPVLPPWQTKRQTDVTVEPTLPPPKPSQLAPVAPSAPPAPVPLPRGVPRVPWPAPPSVAPATPAPATGPPARRGRICPECADLPHRRPEAGCPTCREPFKPEALLGEASLISNAGALLDL